MPFPGVRRVVDDDVHRPREPGVPYALEKILAPMHDALKPGALQSRAGFAVVVKGHPHLLLSVLREVRRQSSPRALRGGPLVVLEAHAPVRSAVVPERTRATHRLDVRNVGRRIGIVSFSRLDVSSRRDEETRRVAVAFLIVRFPGVLVVIGVAAVVQEHPHVLVRLVGHQVGPVRRVARRRARRAAAAVVLLIVRAPGVLVVIGVAAVVQEHPHVLVRLVGHQVGPVRRVARRRARRAAAAVVVATAVGGRARGDGVLLDAFLLATVALLRRASLGDRQSPALGFRGTDVVGRDAAALVPRHHRGAHRAGTLSCG
jgi:hypothetical protein